MSISSLRISGSALTAERVRLDTISENIANAGTTRGVDGLPYRRRQLVFETIRDGAAAGGVRVAQIVERGAGPQRVYNPNHPDADVQGYVAMPDVNLVEEMVDLVAATRAYEANAAAVNATKALVSHALDLGR